MEIWKHTHQIMSNGRSKQNVKWYVYMWGLQLSPWAIVAQVPSVPRTTQSDPHNHDPSTSETSSVHKIKFSCPSPAPRPGMIWPCQSPAHPQSAFIHPTHQCHWLLCSLTQEHAFGPVAFTPSLYLECGAPHFWAPDLPRLELQGSRLTCFNFPS